MPEYPYDAHAYDERYRKAYEVGAAFWREPIPTEALAKFVSESRLFKGLNVIEFGCGEGRDSIFLAKIGFDVTGIDVSRPAIKRAHERAKKEAIITAFVVADIMNLPVKDEIYDLAINVSCLQMIIHQSERDKHLHEAYRALKRGGTYFSCNNAVDRPTSVEEFYQKLGRKPGDLVAHKIEVQGKEKEICLPIIVAWPKSKEQYLEEFQRVGFNIVKIDREETKPAGDCWVLVAEKSHKN